ncbi:MAG: proteobacterial dedicated sortase system histidine kinase [Lysobacteraceae bacterium]|nr:MAG: proteobacterial dedicated sortase system histidine kinase [Xanthomonadaceae bacterium]
MPLRLQLALVSLCLLLLPLGGWQVLQQMERLLREGQQEVLLAVAEGVRRELEQHPDRLPPPGPRWFVQALPRQPVLDAVDTEWPDAGGRTFEHADGAPALEVRIGRHGASRYLFVKVTDPSPRPADAHWPQAGRSDHLQLLLDGANGPLAMRLANAEDGALRVTAIDGGPSWLRLAGAWRRSEGGYRVELMLPPGWPVDRLGLVAVDADEEGTLRRVGQVDGRGWTLWEYREDVADWLAAALPAEVRGGLVAAPGWVYARGGELPVASERPLPWWRQQLWYALAWSDQPVDRRLDGEVFASRPEVHSALEGRPAHAWRRDATAPRLLLASAVPLRRDGEIVAALWLQREQQTLLLSDRAVQGLLGWSLGVMAVVALTLLGFASRLGLRIRRLRDAAEGAQGRDGSIRPFEPSAARDEIGDLSRSFARLLKDIAASQSYLRTLAGKLSHELNTPLAIVRGALDNMDGARLDAGTRALVERARGGAQRLAVIVRAMSEAGRIEQAMASAEGETVELGGLLRQCAEAYRDLLAPRRLELVLPAEPCPLRVAPELLVQALDKLIDNARGFCPESGWVRIVLERGADGVNIVVANSGPPLPAAIRSRLFESLVSERPEHRTEGVHLGLGLYIVRLICERHGGSCEARDLEGAAGVEFVLRLRGVEAGREQVRPSRGEG